MTYTIELPRNIYHSWSTYRNWEDQYQCDCFSEWLLNEHSEILATKFVKTHGIKPYRTIEFKSDDHYHWFLLQQ